MALSHFYEPLHEHIPFILPLTKDNGFVVTHKHAMLNVKLNRTR